ncbi:hypothetical protein [Thiocystis violacea]|uniref:hypothetical protein n=1 Tax=Thiocystis violacea TaxID=13725 RepID=UPI001904F978|nr:hypothetical protein [Thiocystis violacea]
MQVPPVIAVSENIARTANLAIVIVVAPRFSMKNTLDACVDESSERPTSSVQLFRKHRVIAGSRINELFNKATALGRCPDIAAILSDG